MLYLGIAILGSFCVNILLKLAAARDMNTQVVVASNYIVAAALGWLLVALTNSQKLGLTTILLGLAGGILWPGGLYLLMWVTRHYGMALAATVSRLSLAIPILFGSLFLGDRLSPLAWVGILLTFVAFFLLKPLPQHHIQRLNHHALIPFGLLVLFFGTTQLWVNLFNHLAPAAEQFVFLTVVFNSSALLSWSVIGIQQLSVNIHAIRLGCILGIPNFCAVYFLQESLKTGLFIDASAIAYTLYSAVGVVLAATTGVLIWHEQMTRANLAGIATTIGAIVLLNLAP